MEKEEGMGTGLPECGSQMGVLDMGWERVARWYMFLLFFNL